MNRKKHILIIEDNEIMGKYLKSFLSGRYEVSYASSAVKGLEIFEKQKVDLVTTDNIHPGPSGMEVLDIVREKYGNLPVIMITGYFNELVKEVECRNAVCIPKPIDLEKLKESIEAVLN
jgi:DNA-binding NtrC family response regulator